MITCKIIISENHNGLCLAMEPDNRDGSKMEIIVATILDQAMKAAFHHINEKSNQKNPVYHEGEMTEVISKMLNEKWPEIKR